MPVEPEVIDLQPATPKDILGAGHNLNTVTDQIAEVVLTGRMPLLWYGAIAAGLALLGLFGLVIVLLFAKGVGIWGIRIPVGWGWAITNFVWWIGIGHAGTLISAILLLLNQSWRNSINRFAEAMTLFAVACAGMFPLLHMGRPWIFYWMFPYPNAMGIQPQFRSPLVWDVFAVSTYATVSLLFWYVGLLPDLGTLRDNGKNKFQKIIYGVLSMGWRGSATHWSIWETACLLLAGLATPLVLSVHTVVSFDFTIAIVPGWHSTFFPPYFVAGAIYSGFAMVLVLAIPLRSAYKLKGLITDKHLDNCGKVMLATGLIVAYAYLMETFTAWYSGNVYEQAAFWNRMTGPYSGYYWFLLTCNIAAPQALWFRKIRQSPGWLFAWSVIVLTGMWLERFVIIVSSLAQDFLPSSWGLFQFTRWDLATFVGTLGLFTFLFFCFVRVLPMISMNEVRTLTPAAKVDREKRMLTSAPTGLHGVMAEFDTPTELVAATNAAAEKGYRKMEAYSPFPIEELHHALHLHKNKLPLLVLLGGITGGLTGFLLQWYITVYNFPTNIAGRPLFSWPAYIVITFELTVLFASATATFGLLGLCGFPAPYHPVFNVPRFERASRDKFFLCIETADPLFELEGVKSFLAEFHPTEVSEVAN